MRRVMVKAFGGPEQLIVESVPEGLRPVRTPSPERADGSSLSASEKPAQNRG
jgi:hypothetical protein